VGGGGAAGGAVRAVGAAGAAWGRGVGRGGVPRLAGALICRRVFFFHYKRWADCTQGSGA
jgi:hypothetical protein